MKKKKIIFICLVVFLSCVVAGSTYALYLVKTLPSPESFSPSQVSQSTKIFDREEKEVLYEIHGEEKRTVVPFEEIPKNVKNAVLAAEDSSFYTNPGFDIKGILRAVYANLKSGDKSQGGSTISQQLARNVFPISKEKTYTRKLKELILAVKLESTYSKDEIFGFYLNQIPFGSNAYGIEAASETYLNKKVQDLTLGESTILAAMIQAPTYYSPWGDNKKSLFERQTYVLERMHKLGMISEDEIAKAKAETPKFTKPSLGTIKAPHFSLMVRDYLIDKYGEQVVMNGGLKVVTTLDVDLQEIAEKSVKEGAEKNATLYKGTNAALVAQNPKNGQILAYVGSRDYFNEAIGGSFNVPLQGKRQPGSALKPFVYLTGFKEGYAPQTLLFDVPTEFDTTGIEENSYKPGNFDDTYSGPVTLQQALAQSMNIPAVKMVYLVGMKDFLGTLKKFGVTTLTDTSRYGLSIVLGGGEVRLKELVNAYATLAQSGVRHEQKYILKVEDSEGEILEEYTDESIRVIEPQYANLITKILTDKDLRSSLFQNSLSLTVFDGYDVALKTGTTNDYRDAWAMGYTPNLAVGVWAGNNNNTPMQKNAGSILAAVPIWSSFLRDALPKTKSESFQEPDIQETANKPMLNGESSFPMHSILHFVDKDDPNGSQPTNPGQDPQYQNWENGILEWVTKNPNGGVMRSTTKSSSEVIKQFDITFQNITPKTNDTISNVFSVKGDIWSVKGLREVSIYVNSLIVQRFTVNGGNFFHVDQKVSGNDYISGKTGTVEIRAKNIDGEERAIYIQVNKE